MLNISIKSFIFCLILAFLFGISLGITATYPITSDELFDAIQKCQNKKFIKIRVKASGNIRSIVCADGIAVSVE